MSTKNCFMLLAIALLSAGCSFFTNEPKLIAPVGGSVINNNMPNLLWEPFSCDYYEIWINGIKTDSVAPTRNSYTAFPQSYGKNTWQIVAIKNNQRIYSQQACFEITDSPLEIIQGNSQLLRLGWEVQSSQIVGTNGAQLSLTNTDTANIWYPTSVPATVLTALVRNGVYPNPYIATNNMRIPDINNDYNQKYDLLKFSHIKGQNPWEKPYWFRTSFKTDSIKNEICWLLFNEINYKAEIWLNGVQVASPNEVIGMERSFRFNVSNILKQNSENILAVAIYPPNNPGEPAADPLEAFADPGQNMADGIISRDYTKWDVLGWDWIPPVRDRDMGITEDVFLIKTNEIEITDLYITSDLPLPDTSSADVTISFTIINHSNTKKEGNLIASIIYETDTIAIEQTFKLNSLQEKEIVWTKAQFPSLAIKNPKLWWPVGYGLPNLYTFNVKAVHYNKQETHATTEFGIRKVETYLGPKSRIFKINGRDIYTRGGNWVLDMMLNWTASRYEQEVVLSKNANLNILRVWGPTGAPPGVFYKAADKHGMLIWQDFLNDYWGSFRNTPGYQPEIGLYEKASIAIVKKYRNHPSLIIWCGGNEGVNPREQLLLKILAKYDPRGQRYYLKASDGDGLHGGGPYHTISPETYFSHPKLSGFSSEIGPSGVPEFESMMKFMPHYGMKWAPGFFPINGEWAFHDANDWPGTDSRKFSSYYNIVKNQYGINDTTGLKAAKRFAEKCQMVNYDVYRASIESINRQLWQGSSGILLWKSNSSWPSLVWQVYDWYLQAHAGYYGVKKAMAPLSIQLNRDNMDISIINANFNEYPNATINAVLYNSNMEVIWNADSICTIKQNTAQLIKWKVPVANSLVFLKLQILNEKGALIADNFYWLHNQNNFLGLDMLKQPKISATAIKQTIGEQTIFEIKLSNNGKSPAIMTALKLIDSASETELLPSVWTNNYISLLPNENVNVKVEVNTALFLANPAISIKAYNMKKALIIVPK